MRLPKEKGENMMKKTTEVLVCAGTLMLIAGVIFGFLDQWLYAVLIWASGFCCFAAALNFKSRKDR